MPHLVIDMYEGRPVEKKRQLVTELTEVVSRVLETPPEGVTIVINDTKRENWSTGGVLACDKAPKK